MKASYLFKHNIDALLRARGQTRHDLAQWCRRTDAWLSKILGKDDRNLPMKYLDRMADFFGLSVYQLFQPGISAVTERRSHRERRSGHERRIGYAARQSVESLQVAPADAAFVRRLNSLSVDERRRLDSWLDATVNGRDISRAQGHPPAAAASPRPPTSRSRRTRA